MNTKVTIKDVARELGLSVSTVSRALSGNTDININTRKKVAQVAKEMNYTANSVAAGLRTRKTKAIGVVVPNSANHFYSSAISGIEEVVSMNDYHLFICQSNESQQEEMRALDALASGRVDGVILSLAEIKNDFEYIDTLNSRMPVVLFDRTVDELHVLKVEAEDYQGAYLAIEHLISVGCKSIVHIAANTDFKNGLNRGRGYEDVMARNGMESHILRYNEAESFEGFMEKLLIEHPNIDGIFAATDEIAVKAILYLNSIDKKVPEDIAIVGFGGFPISEVVRPQLTTINHRPYHLGYNAAVSLFKKLGEGNPELKEVDSNLIIRDSTTKS